MPHRRYIAGIFTLLGGCTVELPSDAEIDRAAAQFEQSQRKRIVSETLRDPEDDGFSKEDEVDAGTDKRNKD